MPKKVYRTAIYCRLSREDGDKLESNSIASQRAICEDYIARHDDLEVVCDPLQIADWLGLWDKLKPHLVIGMTYVARAVLLDSNVPLHSYAPVLERVFPVGEVTP